MFRAAGWMISGLSPRWG